MQNLLLGNTSLEPLHTLFKVITQVYIRFNEYKKIKYSEVRLHISPIS